MIAGSTRSYGAGEWDFWLIKTDALGNMQWSKTFGGINHDNCRGGQPTSDGGYILIGDTENFSAVGRDFLLIKTDANGNEEWTRTYGGRESDRAYSVLETDDGGYIFCGSKDGSEEQQYCDVWLVKTDNLGNVEWNKTYDYLGCHAITQSSDGGYMLLGGTRSNETRIDILLIKIDEEGNIIWNKTYGEKGDDFGFSIIHASNNGYVIVGRTTSFGADGVDILLMKVSEDGEFVNVGISVEKVYLISRIKRFKLGQIIGFKFVNTVKAKTKGYSDAKTIEPYGGEMDENYAEEVIKDEMGGQEVNTDAIPM